MKNFLLWKMVRRIWIETLKTVQWREKSNFNYVKNGEANEKTIVNGLY